PTAQESIVFNAIAVTLVEHGVTPSAIAARMTYLGAPEALQAAVAAGVRGAGGRVRGPTGGGGPKLAGGVAEAGGEGDLQTLAEGIVARHVRSKRPLPGLGHPVHKPIDPRTPRLFAVAKANGFSGRYVELMQEVAEEASRSLSRDLPVNATGAIGAIASELELPWQVCRGLAVMARAIGLLAHLQEEQRKPQAAEIWARVEEEASEPNTKRD